MNPQSDDTIRIKHRIIPARIDALKVRVAELIPEVPASHRVEALARGLGFRTWASLLAWKQTGAEDRREVCAAEFRDYLASRGETVPKIAFESAISLTSPRGDGRIPTREEALASMGADTWDAWGSGNSEYEDKINAQITFVKEAICRTEERMALRTTRKAATVASAHGHHRIAADLTRVADKMDETGKAMEALRRMREDGTLLSVSAVRQVVAERSAGRKGPA